MMRIERGDDCRAGVDATLACEYVENATQNVLGEGIDNRPARTDFGDIALGDGLNGTNDTE